MVLTEVILCGFKLENRQHFIQCLNHSLALVHLLKVISPPNVILSLKDSVQPTPKIQRTQSQTSIYIINTRSQQIHIDLFHALLAACFSP